MLPTSLIPKPATLPSSTLTDKYGIWRLRTFALIVGIDSYKSGRIWNIWSCKDYARDYMSGI